MTHRRLPSLSALRAFEAAARHLSAKQAAAELSVTPTAISHQIRLLEDTLGVALFIRKPRQLLLTPQGRLLLGTLADAFDTIADTVARLQAPPARQVITLSTTPAIAMRWLLSWVCILRSSHPTLDLRIHASHDVVPLDGVTADLAIRYGRGPWAGMVSEKLFDNLFVPACSPLLGLTEARDLPRHPLIHFAPPNEKGSPVDWPGWQKLARIPGLDPTAGLTFSDETHTISAAVSGQGVALMSRALIMDELDSGRLVEPFGPTLPAEPFHLVYPENRQQDPLILAVRDWVLNLPGGQCVLP
ncbi:LysR family transcriptional regulator [Isoalcanivorax pacificus W11-5]|uniref:LysR family transcriptional regulator n=1 Tax=Isoalcanivorax pacificus W11-5 TaxID=391936 RepID=A0A0B4XGG5_9GAMM|nr:LysR substrate-binding domain-containing protein [Isoalcanivorax pacificus]AJD47199.1 LysR family transcriptional regulator [Isoalcanivorax pacificus W11-5]